jgi:Pvc16 N-terminal domain
VSDFRAIGGVTATLQTLLVDRMELPDGMTAVPVTIGPPPFSVTDANPHREEARLNLFLYRVTENGYLQNQEIPGRSASSGYGHPPLSLNLHYLVTGYGNQEIQLNGAAAFDDTDAHFVLGSAMRVLHDVPIVTDSLTTTRPPSGMLVLHESLRDEFERIRLSLEPLTLEDVTKVWTALALRYRLSAAYCVNVVQIESRRPRVFPRPVGRPASPTQPPLPTDPPGPGPWVQAITIQTPTITELRVRRVGSTDEQPFPYAAIGDTIVLRGTSLANPETSVAFGDLVVPASFASPLLVEAVIPDVSIAGAGTIPPERRLQPGVRTVRVIANNPQVPHGAVPSNEAVFMLVPAVNPATLAYAAGPPRTLTIDGSRLAGTGPGGEVVIGRSSVPRSAYVSESESQLVVPVPSSLPTRGVHVVIGDPLTTDPVTLGAGPHTLRIKIGPGPGTVGSRTRTLPSSLPLAEVAAIVESMIHDAAPAGSTPDLRFLDARVLLWNTRLLVLPGDLTSPIVIDSPVGSTFADDLKLTAAPQPAGASSAFVSGSLGSPPPLSAVLPRFQLTIGGAGPVVIDAIKATSLDALAIDLQAKINAFGPAEFAGATVAAIHGQLLLIPGAAGVVSCDPLPAIDERTVAELQLHALFSVRVRVNGAESIDLATVELPQ